MIDGGMRLATYDNRVTLIDWSLWFASNGIRNTNRRRIRFNSLPLLLQAACEGRWWER